MNEKEILNFIIYACLFLTIVHLSLFIFVSRNPWFLVCSGLGLYAGSITVVIKRLTKV